MSYLSLYVWGCETSKGAKERIREKNPRLSLPFLVPKRQIDVVDGLAYVKCPWGRHNCQVKFASGEAYGLGLLTCFECNRQANVAPIPGMEGEQEVAFWKSVWRDHKDLRVDSAEEAFRMMTERGVPGDYINIDESLRPRLHALLKAHRLKSSSAKQSVW